MKNLSIPVIFGIASMFLFSSCGKDEKVTKTNSISFEEILLGETGYLNGSDGSNGFTSGNAFFRTNYNTEWDSWSGFALTNHADTITRDFTNQYSSVTGSGAAFSDQYVVMYSFSEDTIEFIIPAKITNLAITNSAYAYFSMKYGDDFSKKFGGVTGDDPDYFALYISVVDSKGERRMFDPIYLADFRFQDNSEDYISNEWIYYNLSSAGNVKYLIFSFDSSDKSEWGINTPTYVCFDNIVCEWEE